MRCPKCQNDMNICSNCGYVRKLRSTGDRSQNHHINSHIQAIAQDTGNDFDTIKLWCKREAISEGYPFETFRGVRVPWSETRLDTLQAGILIETIHRLAAELNIRLVEVREW